MHAVRRTLFFYIAREMALYFIAAFLFFFLIFFVNQILLMAEQILSKHAPIRQVLLLIAYSLPSIVATSAPFATLVGTLMGIGRFVSDREFLAMTALGVPSSFAIVPVIAVGAAIALASFVSNDILLPAGTIQFNRLYKKILTSTPAIELESDSVKRNQDAIVVSGTVRENSMDGILIIDVDASGNRRIVSASSVDIIPSSSLDIMMTLSMRDASVFSLRKDGRLDFDRIRADGLSYNILTKNLLSSYASSPSPREMSSRDLYGELVRRRSEKPSRSTNMYLMEFHKKFAIPLAALFFSFLAFSLGLGAKSNGQTTGFIFGLIIAVFYWALLIGGQTLSMRLGLNGALMMWIPDVAICGFGAAFLVLRILP